MKRMVAVFALAATFAACNNNSTTSSQLKAEAYKQIRDSLKLDSFQRAEAKEIEIAEERERILALQQAAPVRERVIYASNSAPRRRTYVKGVSESYTYSQPQPVRKKGWSHAAKGAAIGAGAGAITGVLVDKKDARGAIIGGVIGAGTGYAIGRAKDRRTGRIQ
ncbi:MAG: hypothetical protein H7Y13_13440 [Sphingobacteriaceae bacterium]|nr:hypothetical protein [Sphingobacteriaceae bacterium]